MGVRLYKFPNVTRAFLWQMGHCAAAAMPKLGELALGATVQADRVSAAAKSPKF